MQKWCKLILLFRKSFKGIKECSAEEITLKKLRNNNIKIIWMITDLKSIHNKTFLKVVNFVKQQLSKIV